MQHQLAVVTKLRRCRVAHQLAGDDAVDDGQGEEGHGVGADDEGDEVAVMPATNNVHLPHNIDDDLVIIIRGFNRIAIHFLCKG